MGFLEYILDFISAIFNFISNINIQESMENFFENIGRYFNRIIFDQSEKNSDKKVRFSDTFQVYEYEKEENKGSSETLEEMLQDEQESFARSFQDQDWVHLDEQRKRTFSFIDSSEYPLNSSVASQFQSHSQPHSYLEKRKINKEINKDIKKDICDLWQNSQAPKQSTFEKENTLTKFESLKEKLLLESDDKKKADSFNSCSDTKNERTCYQRLNQSIRSCLDDSLILSHSTDNENLVQKPHQENPQDRNWPDKTHCSEGKKNDDYAPQNYQRDLSSSRHSALLFSPSIRLGNNFMFSTGDLDDSQEKNMYLYS